MSNCKNIEKKEKICGIYKIENPNGKVYVGQSRDIYKRWDSYKQKGCKSQIKLHRSIKKYGFEFHIFTILETCSIDKLNEKEIYWGTYYNSISEKNLNLRLGNQAGVISKETIERIREGAKKAKRPTCSDSTKKKLSKIKLGKKHNNETIAKLKNIDRSYCKKVILQYDVNMKFIKEWTSIKEAGKHYGKDGTSVSACLSGRTKTSIGFIWKYK